MNFNDIELRLRYPHVFQAHDHPFECSAQTKSAVTSPSTTTVPKVRRLLQPLRILRKLTT